LRRLDFKPKVPSFAACTAWERFSVAIYRLLQKQAFNPEDIAAMTKAYEKALVDLRLERTDARTEGLAKQIIEIAHGTQRRFAH
jgi:hypothetical protein